jgi:hypothetical protein
MTVIGYPWDKPPARLTADEVHVWHAELDPWVERVPWLTQILSPDERARAERFCFPRDRQHFIVCRGLLRTILGRYLKLVKATGEGLSGLEQVEISMAPGEPATLLRIGGSPGVTERWSMHEPAVAPGYVAAIVVAGGSDACIYSPSPNAGGRLWSRSHAPH